MLNLLYNIEVTLPNLLKNEEIWKSLYIDYHPPIVERLWTDFNGVRVYLHRINPCTRQEALFHKHPWPSAMRIVKGKYEMGVSFHKGHQIPEIAATVIMPEGSAYEMIHPDGWHYVRPLETPTLSLMVAGPPWMPNNAKRTLELKPLSQFQKNNLLIDFRNKYN